MKVLLQSLGFSLLIITLILIILFVHGRLTILTLDYSVSYSNHRANIVEGNGYKYCVIRMWKVNKKQGDL